MGGGGGGLKDYCCWIVVVVDYVVYNVVDVVVEVVGVLMKVDCLD